ncbi:MAG TPA: ABC transporter ATP-binding protein [Anaerohalosphaeraceae bacterium]|nr:ABC transporter ATP-binding protein [Phycisphaerae bacterium]HOK94553.1 ABC transporter ATP-binding protein [Anaerohalosphaeraceae bacterium]HOL32210.1 ABC transporter ATP-binding protein [Anaerohalosphaeraceae bacterium]HOM76916.1 ABC transporter ATP-binding protein [Anaerohalosphaeraceae bacterium]HPC63269.1 ABC transporter ATP-binding protein [Anaerohalosphaeraceae bacterium]
MSHHIVQACDLHYVYPDGTIGLAGVNFRISHGESVALVGANGAGKSTLLLHLSGCLLPTKGSVQIGDWAVTSRTRAAVRRSVGMVFQDSDDQLFMPTVFEDVAFGPMNLGFGREEVIPVAMKALERVGISQLKDRPPYKLSAGEKRRAAIAAVLAMSPDVLLMDEPSSSLDPRSRRELIALLQTFEHTKIIATHDLDLAIELCPRTIVLNQGRIIRDGPTLTVFTDDELLAQSRLEKPLSMQNCPLCSSKKPRQ